MPRGQSFAGEKKGNLFLDETLFFFKKNETEQHHGTKPSYLLQADFSVSSSGDTYCAVPTNELALAAKLRKYIFNNVPLFSILNCFKAVKDRATLAEHFFSPLSEEQPHLTGLGVIPCLLSDDNCFAVPKSVIWMCMSSLRRIFSGFRSLKVWNNVWTQVETRYINWTYLMAANKIKKKKHLTYGLYPCCVSILTHKLFQLSRILCRSRRMNLFCGCISGALRSLRSWDQNLFKGG